MIVSQGPVLLVEPPLLPRTRPIAPASVPAQEAVELADAGLTLAESQRRHILAALDKTGCASAARMEQPSCWASSPPRSSRGWPSWASSERVDSLFLFWHGESA